MAAGGKAHHPDAFGIDGIAARAPPDHPHRALRIGERDIRPRLPAVTGQSIGEHIGADPARREPAAKLVSLLRSEEHTSELQSLMRISYAVFCLKKKKTRIK